MCRTEKPDADFSVRRKSPDGLAYICRVCNRAKAAKWRKANPARVKTTRRARHLRVRYGLHEDEYTAMHDAQGGKCAICHVGFGKRVAQIDHDHKTGKVRALLCLPCNTSLGHVENESWLRKAMLYLNRHHQKPTA